MVQGSECQGLTSASCRVLPRRSKLAKNGDAEIFRGQIAGESNASEKAKRLERGETRERWTSPFSCSHPKRSSVWSEVRPASGDKSVSCLHQERRSVWSEVRLASGSRARGALAGVIVVGGMLCLPPKSAAEEIIVRVAPPLLLP
jgi:hypothetical protein